MNIELYCSLMDDVKRRDCAIVSILKKDTTTAYQATNIEFIYLQIRKILELISLASLVANKAEFEKQQLKYENYWNARYILNDIERINPMFYPRPVIEVATEKPDCVSEIVDIREGYLTKDEFVNIYEKCGKLMHSENPFGSKIDYKYYEQQIDDWMPKIRKLLNSHIVKLLCDDNLYLIHMKENRDEYAHGYVLGKI